VKTIQIEKATLDSCIAEAQQDRVVITRNGAPVAMIVGVGGLDEEHVQLSGSDTFWELITERRQQKSLSRAEVERRLSEAPGETP
jgi:antitoxin (DNA-binding transcriptional repressor) of toxin-antitoxin stability system